MNLNMAPATELLNLDYIWAPKLYVYLGAYFEDLCFVQKSYRRIMSRGPPLGIPIKSH